MLKKKLVSLRKKKKPFQKLLNKVSKSPIKKLKRPAEDIVKTC